MNNVIEYINKIETAAILPHINADGDAIGSCLAMREVLRSMGKKADIYAEEAVESRLDFIADNIIVYSGEQVDCDTCIVLDCGDEERMGERKSIADSAKHVINIDHHFTNTRFGDAVYVDAKASATGEILARLFKKMNIELGRETAKYLYTAICSDTGGFAYSNVSPETFRIAADLIGYDIDHAEISRLLFDCVDLKSELLKAELTGRIHSYYNGMLNLVSADEALAEKYDIPIREISDLVNVPRRIRGTEVAASLKLYDGKIRVSLRSNGKANVAETAMKFGGGGHAKAAGCTIDASSLEEAEKLLVEAIGEIIK